MGTGGAAQVIDTSRSGVIAVDRVWSSTALSSYIGLRYRNIR